MSAISYEALLESLFDGVYYVDRDGGLLIGMRRLNASPAT